MSSTAVFTQTQEPNGITRVTFPGVSERCSWQIIILQPTCKGPVNGGHVTGQPWGKGAAPHLPAAQVKGELVQVRGPQ